MLMGEENAPLVLAGSPAVIMLIGLNGSGKTTSAAKLALHLRKQNRRCLLVAADVYRPAAIEQLEQLGQQIDIPVFSLRDESDVLQIAEKARLHARHEGFDTLLIDTAGRLQNKTELMAELEKIIRVIGKHDESAPHAVLLTLDATTGQNALSQVDVFRAKAGVTGLVMTKLDGTARGGILVAIAERTGLPVHFIGIGEGVDDLQPFAAQDFAAAIAGTMPETELGIASGIASGTAQ